MRMQQIHGRIGTVSHFLSAWFLVVWVPEGESVRHNISGVSYPDCVSTITKRVTGTLHVSTVAIKSLDQ